MFEQKYLFITQYFQLKISIKIPSFTNTFSRGWDTLAVGIVDNFYITVDA